MSAEWPSKMINSDIWTHFDNFYTNGISKKQGCWYVGQMIPQILDKCHVGQVGCWKTGLISEKWEPKFFKKKQLCL